MKRISIGIIIAFFGLAALPVYSQNQSILKLADDYSHALKKFQIQKNRRSIEGILRKGKAVAEKLDELESLNKTEYSLLERKMRGFVVNRDEILFIEPDSKFFAKLAARHGTRADIAFFYLLGELRPDGVWAAYIEQQTDVTGCTIYGQGLLTKLYGKSLQFKKNYPKSYISDIDEEINAILSGFTESLCACGERESVLKEFRLFIKTFPKDKNTPAIKKRLAEIKKSKDFRFKCQSG
ncbi:MAG: hypothetical protein ABI954_01160 [Pyrinomonadaceae bacterium]